MLYIVYVLYISYMLYIKHVTSDSRKHSRERIHAFPHAEMNNTDMMERRKRVYLGKDIERTHVNSKYTNVNRISRLRNTSEQSDSSHRICRAC